MDAAHFCHPGPESVGAGEAGRDWSEGRGGRRKMQNREMSGEGGVPRNE